MSNSNILIIGATGLLGSAITHRLAHLNPLTPIKFSLDITDLNSINHYFESHKPVLIINVSGYPKVELCEEKIEQSKSINSLSLKNIAQVCHVLNVPLIHFSTDYVFDGKHNKPYLESDLINPINQYGAHKLEAENFIKSRLDKYLIFRTSWLYGASKPNFVSLIMNPPSPNKALYIVNDQLGTPNSVDFIAQEINFVTNMILKKNGAMPWGTYNLSSGGITSWFNFAEKIIKFSDCPSKIKPISTQNYCLQNNIQTQRPLYTPLDPSKYQKTFHRKIPHWEELLQQFFREESSPLKNILSSN